MIKIVSKVLFTLAGLVFVAYLIIPEPKFPDPPAGSLQSGEPADIESPHRRAYFTNLTRREVLRHYESQFRNLSGFSVPTYRLNYPPEDARFLIRDLTRSTFLEEIVHPFRESVFVNGFEPKDPKDAIEIKGQPWRQKIIVKYVPSSTAVRLVIAAFTLISIWVLSGEYFGDLKRLLRRES